ncbi:hypothetical protein Q2941_30460 [Bradyrhizobium sp. UFLA05-153]
MLSEQLDEEPSLRDEGNCDRKSSYEEHDLHCRKSAEPGNGAGAWVRPTLPHHEAGDGCEDAIASQRLPTGRCRVELAEAMAVRLIPLHEIGADNSYEDKQQDERAQGAPPR